MRYESEVTARGNMGVSYASQAKADAQAAAMDAAYCRNCTDCTDCTDCAGVLRWSGPPATALVALNGFKWPVATDGITVQIGCQCHTVEQWRSVSESALMRMDRSAPEQARKYLALVLSIAEARAALSTDSGV